MSNSFLALKFSPVKHSKWLVSKKALKYPVLWSRQSTQGLKWHVLASYPGLKEGRLIHAAALIIIDEYRPNDSCAGTFQII